MTRYFPVATLLLVPVVLLWAAPADIDDLQRNSPFGPPPGAASGPVSDAPLELRGIMVDGGETFFSLYEVATHQSLWVGMNEPGNPFTVRTFDREQNMATVEYQGRSLALPIKQAKTAVLPASGPVVAGPRSMPYPANVAPATPPADEAAKLAAVAEEVRRRRALRAQGSN